MEGILPRLPDLVKRRISKLVQKTRDAGVHRRGMIILNLSHRRTVAETARVVGVAESTVRRVAERFRECGEASLFDGREDNGEVKLDERYLANLDQVVRSNPQEHGYERPTWTRELLVEVMRKRTGVRIHVATMSRALKQISARRGRPRPTVECPWPKRAKNARLGMIRRLIETLPKGHVAVYQDEVDIHLNPKIGLDGLRSAERGPDAGEECQAIPGWGARRSDGTVDVGRSGEEEQLAVHPLAPRAPQGVSVRGGDPRHPG